VKRLIPIMLFLLAGCTGIQSPLNPAGDQAQSLSGLLTLMSWICGIMYLLVIGFLGTSLWRSRRKLADAPPVVDPADTALDGA
jgi:cytochrome c oxidase subunit 2